MDLVEGPLDALKQTSDHSCSTTSITSMAGTLPSESDVEDGLIPLAKVALVTSVTSNGDGTVKPKFPVQATDKMERSREMHDWLGARITRRYSQSRDLTIRVVGVPGCSCIFLVLLFIKLKRCNLCKCEELQKKMGETW